MTTTALQTCRTGFLPVVIAYTFCLLPSPPIGRRYLTALLATFYHALDCWHPTLTGRHGRGIGVHGTVCWTTAAVPHCYTIRDLVFPNTFLPDALRMGRVTAPPTTPAGCVGYAVDGSDSFVGTGHTGLPHLLHGQHSP